MTDRVTVTALAGSPTGHGLVWSAPGGAQRTAPCSIGRGGLVPAGQKREGDGKTPIGDWPVRRVLYRRDRIAQPVTALPSRPVHEDDGWCDQPDHPAYNRPVRLPFDGRHETLWRADGLYDLIVVLGHNDDPPQPGQGSAIFLHLARPDWAATEGCVAVGRAALADLLADLGSHAVLSVQAPR